MNSSSGPTPLRPDSREQWPRVLENRVGRAVQGEGSKPTIVGLALSKTRTGRCLRTFVRSAIPRCPGGSGSDLCVVRSSKLANQSRLDAYNTTPARRSRERGQKKGGSRSRRSRNTESPGRGQDRAARQAAAEQHTRGPTRTAVPCAGSALPTSGSRERPRRGRPACSALPVCRRIDEAIASSFGSRRGGEAADEAREPMITIRGSR